MEWADRIGRRIKLRDLHVLLTVAQFGSMARAAQHLSISQPVISKTVADLEYVLGVRLLDRDRHGAELTVYGRALLTRGLAAFDELRQGVQDIASLRDPEAGLVRIGAPDAMIAGFIPTIIDGLSRRYPRLRFQISIVPSSEQFHALRDREFEVLIGRMNPSQVDDDVNVEVLFNEPLLVAASSKSRWQHRRRIQLAELIDEPWVLPHPDSLPGTLIRELFYSAGLGVPTSAVICSSILMNDALLATGRYLAIYPGSVLRSAAKRAAIRPLRVQLPSHDRPVGIASLKKRLISPTAQLFIDNARVVANSLMGGTPRRASQRAPTRPD